MRHWKSVSSAEVGKLYWSTAWLSESRKPPGMNVVVRVVGLVDDVVEVKIVGGDGTLAWIPVVDLYEEVI